MMDYLLEWVRNLSSYLVLVTVVSHVAPEGTCQKYLRFFAGLVLAVLLASPLLELLHLTDTFTGLYESAVYEQQLREMEEASRFLENLEVPLWEEGSEDIWTENGAGSSS